MSQIQSVLNQIMSDEQFRSALIENPFAAMEESGVETTSEMLTTFEGLTASKIEDLNVQKSPYC